MQKKMKNKKKYHTGHHTMAKGIKVSVISEQENGALQNM
jgi:hypothetical protein